MFQFLFKYPLAVFEKGRIVFLASLPWWLLLLAIVAAAGTLGFLLWRRGAAWRGDRRTRGAAIWLLQSALATLLLLLLWRPALSVAVISVSIGRRRLRWNCGVGTGPLPTPSPRSLLRDCGGGLGWGPPAAVQSRRNRS